MLGLKIYLHAVQMVLRNIPAVLRIFWLPMLIGVVVFAALIFLFGLNKYMAWGHNSSVPLDQLHSAFLPVFFVVWIVTAIAGTWGVTAWHRYILLDEFASGLVPDFSIGRAGGYLLRLFLLGLIFMVIALPAVFILMAVAQAVWQLALVLMIALFILLGVLMLRWSLILPGFAISKPLTLSQSWELWSTVENPRRTMVGLLIVGILVQFCANLAVEVFQFSPLAYVLLGILVQMFFGILNVSILTTVYGYVVEKRVLI